MSGDKKYRSKQARAYDEAAQIYIDTKRNPTHIEKYYDDLTPEQQKVVDLSQNLPEEIKQIAEKIESQYEELGVEGVDAGVLKNMLDDYASRTWDLEGKKGRIEKHRKFGRTTRHAKQRKFETVIEGWAKGHELKVKGATENLRIYKETLVRTIEDKKFVDELMEQTDLEGNPLLTTKELEGYVELEHPNMTVWERAGEMKEGETYGKKLLC